MAKKTTVLLQMRQKPLHPDRIKKVTSSPTLLRQKSQ